MPSGTEGPFSETAEYSFTGTEMTGLRLLCHRVGILLFRLRRKLPYLVWYGEEVDVGVTLKDIAALGGDPKCAFEAQMLLSRMGITFDTGSGGHGRDWEWDFSLRGPISVQFRSRARNPERRVAAPVPVLVTKYGEVVVDG